MGALPRIAFAPKANEGLLSKISLSINKSITVVVQPGTMVEVIPQGYCCDWPHELPRNYDELVKTYGVFVAKRVAFFNKVPRNLEDLIQDIWMRLVGAQVLEKFVAGAALRLPDQLTVAQAIDFLGVTPHQWRKAVTARKSSQNKWIPQTIDGGDPLCPQSKFSTAHVRILDEVLSLSITHRPNVRRRPPITSHGWKAYLVQAIHNHYSNFCRTRKRRYQELLVDPTALLVSKSGDGGAYHLSSVALEDAGSWEDQLTKPSTLGEEDLMTGLIQAKRELKKSFEDNSMTMGQMLSTESYETEDGRTLSRAAPEAQAGLEVLDSILSGNGIGGALQAQGRAHFRELYKTREAFTS